MSIALWSILFAGLLPYLTVGIAKFSGGGYDNARPREWAGSLTGLRARAHAAHQNHFEFLPLYAAGVMLAEWKAGPGAADMPALAIMALRLGYTGAYLADRPSLRSLLWALALAGVAGLFALAARGG
ncbi:MAPEG family protein [Rhabdaerophilum calidifontis]|uniref:MAPEG family protein n=1 Tax=Rhabdaerophilum calidifontis TaxID=2604328 RepID=UPI00123910A5|nr:MAPEG family protein [Rhabdaerophilum calidifontis]